MRPPPRFRLFVLWLGLVAAAAPAWAVFPAPVDDSALVGEEKTLLHFTFSGCAGATAVDLPPGAAVQDDSGLFTWLPDYGSAGAYTVRVRCADGMEPSAAIRILPATPLDLTSGSPRVTLAGTATWSDPADENDQKSWAALARLYGLKVTEETDLAAAFAAGRVGEILIVPWHVARTLDPATVDQIVAYAQDGGRVLLSGRSALAQVLGIAFTEETVGVTAFRDYLNPTFPLTWSAAEEVERIALAPQDAVFTATPDGGTPLALGRRVGVGRLLYLATRHYDRHSPYGTKGHPYLVYHFADFFKLRSLVSGGNLDAYFDPGNYDLTAVYVEDLARRWQQLGIRTVYAAAWHFWVDEDTGAEWTFDYAHFIEVCHQRGIRVYAWFAFPHVTQKFWVQHPECREQTAGGTDINQVETITWRSAINLQAGVCLDGVEQVLADTLSDYPWDGANLAEIYYEFLRPDPDWFTPMNGAVRDRWKQDHGFDPVAFFDPDSPLFFQANGVEWQQFLTYRTNLVTEAHRQLLQTVFEHIGAGKEVLVTLIDTYHEGYEGFHLDDVGVDVAAITALMDEFDFTLELEDQVALWSANPLRYRDFRDTYFAAFDTIAAAPNRLLFDFNVHHEAHDPYYAFGDPLYHFPAYKQTGVEVQLTLQDLMVTAGRAALFSEHTLETLDLERAADLAAVTAAVDRWSDRDYSVATFHTSYFRPPASFDNVLLDGEPWPCWSAADARLLLPLGNHRITLPEGAYSGLRLADISADLLAASMIEQGIEVRYRSPRQKAVLTLEDFAAEDAGEFTVTLDGVPHDPPIYPFYGHYHLFLPRGEHVVRITAGTDAANPASGGARPGATGSDEVCFIGVSEPGRAQLWWVLLLAGVAAILGAASAVAGRSRS